MTGPLTLAELEHWELFGGTVRVQRVDDRRAVLDLCSCTGELVERRESDDPAVLDRLGRAGATGLAPSKSPGSGHDQPHPAGDVQ